MVHDMRHHDRATVSASDFETGYADLKEGPIPVLDALIEKHKHTQHAFDIVGHTADDTSDDAYNFEMSLRRADSVKCYLHRAGIHPTRIRTAGRGASVPVTTNKTARGRELNRRVEVTVIPE